MNNNNKLVYYQRKFGDHCFIIMATIISHFLWVKNYCQCLHGLSHSTLTANLSRYSYYFYFEGMEHSNYQSFGLEGSEP